MAIANLYVALPPTCEVPPFSTFTFPSSTRNVFSEPSGWGTKTVGPGVMGGVSGNNSGP